MDSVTTVAVIAGCATVIAAAIGAAATITAAVIANRDKEPKRQAPEKEPEKPVEEQARRTGLPPAQETRLKQAVEEQARGTGSPFGLLLFIICGYVFGGLLALGGLIMGFSGDSSAGAAFYIFLGVFVVFTFVVVQRKGTSK
jgi:hypothetical protein